MSIFVIARESAELRTAWSLQRTADKLRVINFTVDPSLIANTTNGAHRYPINFDSDILNLDRILQFTRRGERSKKKSKLRMKGCATLLELLYLRYLGALA